MSHKMASSENTNSNHEEAVLTTTATIKTLRIVGLGHNLILKNLDQEFGVVTISDLWRQIYMKTGLPPQYQRLIGPKRFKIDCEDYYNNTENDGGGNKSATTYLVKLGIQDRTKLLLLHSPVYGKEQDSYERLVHIENEIRELQQRIQQNSGSGGKYRNKHYVAELITKICCKLDGVEIQGSHNLRKQRKGLLRKAEELEHVVFVPDEKTSE